MKGANEMKCLFGHKWNNWIVYNHIDDIVKGSYNGKAPVMDYIPVYHFKTCKRCGKLVEHDFRIKPMEGVILNERYSTAYGKYETNWADWGDMK